MNEAVYLRPDVTLEPLVNAWYAWPLLIYPPTLGLITRNSHLKLLDSFVKSPQIHLAASRNPAMRGGPFVNHEGPVADIEALARHTREALAPEIALGNQLIEFHTRLAAQDGASLEPLYAELPQALRGVTELRYDLRSIPSLRLIEPLVYQQHNSRRHQSLRLVQLDPDNRPFALSTPRVGEDTGRYLKAAFDDPAVDVIAACRTTPIRLPVLHEQLAALSEQPLTLDQVRAMTTALAPHQCALAGDVRGQRIRYLGHAAALVQTGGLNVLVDPSITTSSDGGVARFSLNDLPARIDLVLLTHNHQDHVLLETLLQLRHRIDTIVVPRTSGNGLTDPSLKLILQHCGFRRVVELGELESLEVDACCITGLPFLGEHGDLDIVGKLAYAIAGGGARSLFLADSNNLDPDLYRHVARHIGPVDCIFIGMECAGAPISWLYGSLLAKPLSRLHDQSRRLNGSNCERALALIDCFNPSSVFVYAMGAEPWVTFVSSVNYDRRSEPIVESDKLVAHLAARGICAERLYARRDIQVLPGQTNLIGARTAEPYLAA